MSDSVYELARENPSSKSLSSQTSVNSKKSSIISCRICLSNILDPASLTCGHKFCERCLENYWDAKDRPDFIVCPLCRTNVFNVNFTKKEQHISTNDFRKTFNSLEDISESEEHSSTISCFKFSILVPAMYYLLKYIILELMTFLQIELGHRVL